MRAMRLQRSFQEGGSRINEGGYLGKEVDRSTGGEDGYGSESG